MECEKRSEKRNLGSLGFGKLETENKKQKTKVLSIQNQFDSSFQFGFAVGLGIVEPDTLTGLV